MNLLVAASLIAMLPALIQAGLDQSPTSLEDYGRCTNIVPPAIRETSHWCKLNKLSFFPEAPNAITQRLMKAGRQTVYTGPIGHKLACNVDAHGSDAKAIVALSTKYFPFEKSAWNPNNYPEYCGKCVCVHVLGSDKAYNPNVKLSTINRFRNFTFMGKVGDRCGECADDSIDILMDRPYSYNPVSNAGEADQGHAANAIAGLRGFSGRPDEPFDVGTFASVWNFVPCSWTHEQCASFVQDLGYQTFTPRFSKGL